jgi:dihydropyrimidinase
MGKHFGGGRLSRLSGPLPLRESRVPACGHVAVTYAAHVARLNAVTRQRGSLGPRADVIPLRIASLSRNRRTETSVLHQQKRPLFPSLFSVNENTMGLLIKNGEIVTGDSLREIVAAGVQSFKIFLAYKGAFGIDDGELYQTLKLAKELGVVTTAHCENETLVAETQKKLLAQGVTGPEGHHESRPPCVEAEGVHHLMTFAEMTGASVYIVHLSCREALEEAIRARLRGVRVWVETLIQYLLLDKTHAELPDFEGSKYVMSPPLRDRRNQEVLWNGLRQGLVNTVGTDHAPFDFARQKPMGRDDFTKIPNGIPALEDRINLLYTYGVRTGRLDLHTFVNIASTNAAKIFNLFPRKGTIQPGSDADLVVYDPDYRGKLSAKTHLMNIDYNAFEGWPIEGRPSIVTIRGEVAVRDGKFVGTVGRGQFLERSTT